MNEEIQFGVGLDTTAFGMGQRRILSMMKEIRDNSGEVKEGFRKAFEIAGVGIGFGMIAEKGKEVIEFGESIKRGAEIAGVSTEFFQVVGAAMRETGGDAETGSHGLEKLTAMIGEAAKGTGEGADKFKELGISVRDATGTVKTTQQVWDEISDRVKAAGSATEAAAIAAGVFGEKLGPQLVSALKMGAQGLDEFGKSVSKLSDEDIKTLHELHSELDADAIAWQVWAGKVIRAVADASSQAGRGWAMLLETRKKHGNFAAAKALLTNNPPQDILDEFEPQPEKKQSEHVPNWAKAVGETKEYTAALKELKKAQIDAATAGMKPQEKLAELELEAAAIQDQMAAIKGTTYERAHSVEMLKLEKDLVEKTAKADNLRLEIQTKAIEKAKHISDLEHEIANAKHSQGKAQEALDNSMNKRSQLTIGELASSKLHFTGQLGEDQTNAKKIEQIDKWAEWNRQHGNLDLNKEQLSRADEIRKSLSSNVVESDRNPFKAEQERVEEAKKQTEHLEGLLDLAKNDGLNVVPVMTQ